jgi:hypothetical protein
VRRWLSIAAVLSMMAWNAQPSAFGYVRSKDPAGRVLAWSSPHFRIRVSAVGPKGLSRDLVLRAARGAAHVWNEVDCSNVAVEIDDASPHAAAVAQDGANVLTTHIVSWCADERGRDCHSSLNPALTTVRFRPKGRADGPARTAEIYEVDIELNGVDYRWDDMSLPNAADAQVVLTHEFGHALGLADACRMPGGPAALDDRGRSVPECTAAPAAVRSSVMWPLGAPNDLRRRRLAAEDRRAICAIYPRRKAGP